MPVCTRLIPTWAVALTMALVTAPTSGCIDDGGGSDGQPVSERPDGAPDLALIDLAVTDMAPDAAPADIPDTSTHAPDAAPEGAPHAPDEALVGDPHCAATLHQLYAFDPARQVSPPAGDLTGDGVPDRVRYTDDGRITIGDGLVLDAPSFIGSLTVGDVGGDGVLDLIMGWRWLNRVDVLFGPLDAESRFDQADVVLVGPTPDGGLAPLFGEAVVLIDVDGDAVRDLLVSRPGEQEEGCLAARPPLLFHGPFPRGDRRTVDEADGELAVDAHCPGLDTACFDGGFGVGSTDEADRERLAYVCFDGDLEEITCPEGLDHRLPFDR